MSEDGQDAKTSFWKTLPGILTGVAALLTALGGFVVVIMQVVGATGQVAQPPAASGPAAVTSAAAAPEPQDEISSAGTTDAPATESGSPPLGSPPAEGDVLYEDRLEMRLGDLADLETGKVGTAPSGFDVYLQSSGAFTAYGQLTRATGPISRSACVAALTERQDSHIEPAELGAEDWICVQTETGRLAALWVVQKAAPGSPLWIFEYVLWK
ncbi:hypothetical protein [Microlunatus parietis]|uniref:Uncharacterized protein n=1 Tax=Microlunatus parietis TaxID=682979 RepID=A0A7Y9I5N6_9ACTN|nr:hypothetical protein [Microlunatus parietis]NYE70174.1 hypothetical protein [Microlunatus parietis]